MGVCDADEEMSARNGEVGLMMKRTRSCRGRNDRSYYWRVFGARRCTVATGIDSSRYEEGFVVVFRVIILHQQPLIVATCLHIS